MNFALLLVCLLLGMFAARLLNPPPQLAAGLNWWVVSIALPCLVFHVVPGLTLTLDMWFLPASMWLVFVISWGLFAGIGHLLRWTPQRIGALTLVCGLGNTAFIGYPMIEALRGNHGLALAAVADQVGCFVMLAVGGAVVSATYSGTSVSIAQVVRRVLLFPPFIAMVISLIAGAAGGWPAALDTIFSRIGDTLVPLALFSVGLQVRLQFQAEQLCAATLGLMYKLAIAPLMILGLGLAFKVSGMTLVISVLQAAMAPMISAAILAEQNDLEPSLANLTLVCGILISFVTVPLWNAFL
jgi:malate permease and related proteins